MSSSQHNIIKLLPTFDEIFKDETQNINIK